MSDVTRPYLRLRKLEDDSITLDVCRRDGEPSASVTLDLKQLESAIMFVSYTSPNQYAFACLPPRPEVLSD